MQKPCGGLKSDQVLREWLIRVFLILKTISSSRIERHALSKILLSVHDTGLRFAVVGKILGVFQKSYRKYSEAIRRAAARKSMGKRPGA